MSDEQLVTLTADIVSAHLTKNIVAVGDVPNLIQQVHGALSKLGTAAPEEPSAKTPAVSARASIKPDYLICMECGNKQKTLKRHLQVAHGMTPEQYRSDYGLPPSYPMTAANYSETRRNLAHAAGLGRKGREALSRTKSGGDGASKPRSRGRPRKAPAKGG